MHTRHLLIILLLISMVTLLIPKPVAAIPAVTFVLGTMIGDSLSEVLQVRLGRLTEGFENSPILGGRMGWSLFHLRLKEACSTAPAPSTRLGATASVPALCTPKWRPKC